MFPVGIDIYNALHAIRTRLHSTVINSAVLWNENALRCLEGSDRTQEFQFGRQLIHVPDAATTSVVDGVETGK